MKTIRQFINGVLERGNWDIRDAFDDILARDLEHENEKEALRRMLLLPEQFKNGSDQRLQDAAPIVAAIRDVPMERRMAAVATAVDAFCQTGGSL